MIHPWQTDALKGLGGTHWGLLPALLILPVLVGQEVAMAGRGLFLLLAAIIASYDVAVRRIPNALTATGALIGLTAQEVLPGGIGLTDSFLGGLVGFGLMAVFYFFGAVGGGDVKAMGALGVFLGPWGALSLFVYTTLAGGVLALGMLVFRSQGAALFGSSLQNLRLSTGKMTMPYALAILAGALIVLARGGTS